MSNGLMEVLMSAAWIKELEMSCLEFSIVWGDVGSMSLSTF